MIDRDKVGTNCCCLLSYEFTGVKEALQPSRRLMKTHFGNFNNSVSSKQLYTFYRSWKQYLKANRCKHDIVDWPHSTAV